ncbi:MAG: LamG-like jellyroll fold domain-containing protein [Fluviicola sp.]
MKRKLYFISALASLSWTASFAQYPTNGLIGYYPFNANIEDVSSNNYDMSANVTPSFAPDRFGQFNALNADISPTYIPIVQNPSEFSFAVWVKPISNTNPYQAIFSRVFYAYDAGSLVAKAGNYQLYLSLSGFGNSYDIVFEGHQGASSPTFTNFQQLNSQEPAGIPVNQWTHIVVTVTSTTMKLYVNNVLSDQETLTTPLAVVGFNDPSSGYNLLEPLHFGVTKQGDANTGIVSDYLDFIGHEDDIFFYNRAISASEVAVLYNLPENPTPAGTASINEQTADLVKVYPNPTADFMHVELTAENESLYSIYSADNREVMHGTLSSGNNSIDVQNLAAGTYFLKTVISGRTVTQKISKQ